MSFFTNPRTKKVCLDFLPDICDKYFANGTHAGHIFIQNKKFLATSCAD
jgi:hypothetical protein